MNKKAISAVLLLFSCLAVLNGQTLTSPNYAIKSHPTLEIRKIVTEGATTTFWMSIENRITGGTFCADKNISLVYPDGSRSKLISSNGIPVCPDSYRFSAIGEKLDFLLVFPAIKAGTSSVSVEEECSENCFSFYGILLDESLNRKIDEAYSLAESGEPANALISFMKIAGATEGKMTGADPVLYLNIIKLSVETGNNTRAAEWYNRFRLSGLPWTDRYISYLKSRGISY